MCYNSNLHEKAENNNNKNVKAFHKHESCVIFSFSETSFLEKEIVSPETKDFFLHILLIFVFPLFSV